MDKVKFGRPKLYLDGKELVLSTNCVKYAPAKGRTTKRPTFSTSATFTLSKEDYDALLWELARPERIKRYINQIFSFQRMLSAKKL